MQTTTIEQFDLSVLPEQAQTELYDFYLFLKQRYTKKINLENHEPIHDNALENLLEFTKEQNIKINPNLNIRELIDQTHDVDI